MSDATEAIIDIREAVEEYGSSITLNIITRGAYDPTKGEGAPVINPHPMKSLINDYTTRELESDNIDTTDIKFRFNYAGVIGYDDEILFDGKIYDLMNIDKKILQDENLIYIIQGRA